MTHMTATETLLNITLNTQPHAVQDQHGRWHPALTQGKYGSQERECIAWKSVWFDNAASAHAFAKACLGDAQSAAYSVLKQHSPNFTGCNRIVDDEYKLLHLP